MVDENDTLVVPIFKYFNLQRVQSFQSKTPATAAEISARAYSGVSVRSPVGTLSVFSIAPLSSLHVFYEHYSLGW